MEKAIHNCLKIETKKNYYSQMLWRFKHLRDKAET